MSATSAFAFATSSGGPPSSTDCPATLARTVRNWCAIARATSRGAAFVTRTASTGAVLGAGVAGGVSIVAISDLDLREVRGARFDEQRLVRRLRDARAGIEAVQTRGHRRGIGVVQLHRVAGRARGIAHVDALQHRAHPGDVFRRRDDDERVRAGVDRDARARVERAQHRRRTARADHLDREHGGRERSRSRAARRPVVQSY